MALTDKSNADSLETVPGAVGTTTLAQIISEKRQIKPLTLNGVTPSLGTLANGKYRLYKRLYLVVSPTTRPLALRFAAFVRSSAGVEILQNNGNWVAPAK